MSAKLVGQVWDKDLPHNEAWVLMALVDHADHDGNNIFPGLGLLAYKTGYSERQLRRILNSLEKKKIVIPLSGGIGRGNRQCYRVDMKTAPDKPEKRPKRPQIQTGKSGHPDNSKADISGTEKRTSKTEKADISGFAYKEHESSVESSIESSERGGEAALSGCLPILIEAYKNIAKDRVSQDQLSWQCQQIEADGANEVEVQEWLKSRRSLSSIRFIAQDFRTWKESLQRERAQQKAKTSVGSDAAFRSVAEIVPASSRRIERSGNWGKVLDVLDGILPPGPIRTWFEPIQECRTESGMLFLVANDPVLREMIESDYAEYLSVAVERAGFVGVVFVDAAVEEMEVAA